jgi:hypothetical protein
MDVARQYCVLCLPNMNKACNIRGSFHALHRGTWGSYISWRLARFNAKNVYQEHLSNDRHSLTVLAAIDDNVLEKRNRRHKQTVPTRKISVLSVTSCLYPTLASESPTFV